MKIKIALVIVSALFCMTSLMSQDEGQLSIQYEMSFATGDLGEFISSASFRGGSIQYRYAITDEILVGVDAGWNVFHEKKESDSYSSGTHTLTGVQYRYQNQVPILISVDYLILSDQAFQPYVGLGIGTMYSERVVDMGTWRLKENPWQFALKPEVGLMYEMSRGSFFKLSAKYYNGFKSGDLETQGYFTISAGLAFNL